jgi:mono/diheme cytochrome c family protein
MPGNSAISPTEKRRRVVHCGAEMALAALLIWTCALIAPMAAAQSKDSGAAIYKDQCARCHGAHGEGAKKYPKPLIGDKSQPQLAALIARTMPDDDPETCTGDDAKNVAAYLYDAFYSPDAQARANPPQVSLSRLTVRQYRSSLADLIGSFRSTTPLDGRHGLHGEYFNAKNLQKESRLIDRLDPEVRFDFGTSGPEFESYDTTFNPHQFCIRWEGSICAPETGTYDIIVRTEMAVKLWLNDPNKALIDALVKSGSDTEYRESIFLIAGRPYPLRLEVYKGRQLGEKDKNPPATKASVQLLWKRPHRSEQIIPARDLSPSGSAEVAVIATPFPPDDRSYGWERGATISKEWVTAVTDASLDMADYVAARLPELAGVAENDAKRLPKIRAFCHTFAERAFRRPLTAAESAALIDRQFDSASDTDVAVKRSIIRTLTSPAFLYPGIAERSTGYGVAARLALVLWDSAPDAALLAAAAEGKLATREQIAAQADRMLSDPRAKAKVHDFLLAWLRIEQPAELVKDAKRFPGFTPALAADLRTSMELFLDDVVWSDTSDFRQLLLSDEVFLNGPLAAFYGQSLPAEAGFTKVKLNPDSRAGVLTHPYLLSALAYPAESSPIHRGVLITRGILGITLRPPPEAFTPLAAEAHPELTTRERIALQTNQSACLGCHSVVNPLGFALEQFDAVGRIRETERGKPIDVHGWYDTRAGTTAKFSGARQLAAFLAGSEEVQTAFTQQLFHQFVKQPVRAYGLQMPAYLHKKFAESGYSIRKLIIETAVIASKPT